MALDMLSQALAKQPQLESLHICLASAASMGNVGLTPEGHTLRMFDQLLKDLVDLVSRSLWLRCSTLTSHLTPVPPLHFHALRHTALHLFAAASVTVPTVCQHQGN